MSLDLSPLAHCQAEGYPDHPLAMCLAMGHLPEPPEACSQPTNDANLRLVEPPTDAPPPEPPPLTTAAAIDSMFMDFNQVIDNLGPMVAKHYANLISTSLDGDIAAQLCAHVHHIMVMRLLTPPNTVRWG